MRARIYHLLRSRTSQKTRDRLKRRLARARRRVAPLYRLRHGSFDADDLQGELARRLPADSEIVMVHCSYNDLAPMYSGGVGDLLDSVLALTGPGRTTAMPAFSVGGTIADAIAGLRRNGEWDVRRAPSRMGILSELFRRRDGVRRSLHPTHSVCSAGPLADELTRNHHKAATTFGEGTPFGVMATRRTAIVGIGTEYFRCLTQVHAAEDLLRDRYPLPIRQHRVPLVLKDELGIPHPYELPMSTTGFEPHIELLERLLGPQDLVRWRFRGVPLFVTTADRVVEVLMDAALRGETIYDARPIR